MALRDLRFRIKSEFDQTGTDAAQRGLRETDAEADRLSGALNRIRLGAVAAIGAIVGVARAMFNAAREGAQFAQELHLVSTGMGISIGRARELERVLNRTGQDISDLRGITAGLASAIGEAVRGNESFAEALRGLGLEASQLAGLGTVDVIRQIVDAILGLGEIGPEEFSFVSQLLGDDDAARIIAAAADLKEGLLAEIKISEDEFADALGTARWGADVANAGQDVQLQLAADVGGVGDSVGASWLGTLGGFFEGAGELWRGGAAPVDHFARDVGAAFEHTTRQGRVNAQRTQSAWLASLSAIDAQHAELRDRSIASFAAMGRAAQREASIALSAWRAVSLFAEETGNPAAQASIGGFGNQDDPNSGLRALGISRTIAGLQANAPEATEPDPPVFTDPEGLLP